MLRKEFDYTSLTFEHRLAIHNALAETTLKHIADSEGLFSALPFDPAASPSQMLEVVHLDSVPASFEDVDGTFGINTMATVAGPNLYPCMQETYRKHPALSSMAHYFMTKYRVHIFPVTPHEKMQDVAIHAAAWGGAMQDDPRWQDTNGTAISRGVTTLEAFGLAASEVMEKAGHAFLSFPRSKTIENLKQKFREVQLVDAEPIDIDLLIDTNNRRMRGEVRDWLGHRLSLHGRGVTYHQAWSGRTDTVLRDEESGKITNIELGRVSPGTLDIVKRGLVLPIALWDGDDPLFEIGELTKVEDEKDIIHVQNWQRERIARYLGLKIDNVTIEAA